MKFNLRLKRLSTVRKLAIIGAVMVIIILLSAYISTFFVGRYALEVTKDEYYLYASSYPVYAISKLICENVPEMNVRMLTQPQEQGYSQYSLSDWDAALMAHADILAFMGFGFESFASEYDGVSAVITLLSLMELKGVDEDCITFNYAYSEDEGGFVSSPWLYMSVNGAMDLLEVMCGNMAYLDQQYSSLYYENLDKSIDMLEPILAEWDDFLLLRGENIAIAHEAFIYTAEDLGANVRVFINRLPAQELSEYEISECIQAMLENEVRVLLIEQQTDDALKQAFSDAGITVISLQLMLDMNQSDGYTGMAEAYIYNLNEIKRAFD